MIGKDSCRKALKDQDDGHTVTLIDAEDGMDPVAGGLWPNMVIMFFGIRSTTRRELSEDEKAEGF